MILSSIIKMMRSINDSQTTLNTLRVFFESEEVKENILALEPEATLAINSNQGLCIISDGVFSVSGDLTLIENTKVLFVGSALDIVITNPDLEDDLNLTIYTW